MARKSDKQEKIFEYLQDFCTEYGYAPTVREIGEAVGLRSPASVHRHLEALRQAGRIDFPNGAKRAISVAARPGQAPILGVVTAGQPILAVEEVEGYLPWDEPDCFALRVRGDSMIGAAILPGDLVVVRRQPTASSGQIVVALLSDEATVKRLKLEPDAVWLMPENSAYDPIDGRNAQILGVVRGVVRTY